MGTNYYLHSNCCPVCGKYRKITHIGKSSAGCKFLFEYYPHKITSVKGWKNRIYYGTIYDEYGEIVEQEEFWEMVEDKQSQKSQVGICDNVVNHDGYDFMLKHFE